MNRSPRHRAALAVLLVLAGAGALPAGAAAPTCGLPGDDRCEAWVAVYDDPDHGLDTPRNLSYGTETVAVAPDGSRVYVTGTAWGGDPAAGGSHYDYVTIAYDATSGEQLWLSRYAGPGQSQDSAWALGVSPDGARVFVTGMSHTGTPNWDFATVAYDAATGGELWAARHDASSVDRAWSLSVSPDGARVFVTGDSGSDYGTVAYDAATGDALWTASHAGPGAGFDVARSVRASPDGERVFVTGVSNGGTLTRSDYATVAYDAATGAEEWASRYNGEANGDDWAYAVAPGPDGTSVYVTGSRGNAAVGPDYATVAYDAVSGDQRWVDVYDGPGGSLDIPLSLAVAADGNVYVTGYSTGSGTSYDYATVSYGADGTRRWEARYNGPAQSSSDIAYAVGTSPDGTLVFVTGESPPASATDNYDIATLAYDAASGAPVWVARYSGQEEYQDGAFALAVSPDGTRLYVNGETWHSSTPGTGDYATLAYATGAAPPAPYARPGRTERSSGGIEGALGDSDSFLPVVSADGRSVAFYSAASNLVPGDTNGRWDVFVHDRASGVTERVSVASDGTEGAGGSSLSPAISADGRFVAFASDARNLVPGDANLTTDIFVHDRATGATERVSVTSEGGEADTESTAPSISADGRFVAFQSLARNLVPGDTNVFGDVFVHDRETGTTERVSVATGGAQGVGGSSLAPSISADGRYVAFHSFAPNLVSGDGNATADVFVHDRETGTTERVSVGPGGAEANASSSRARLSADGRSVAFDSGASNLVPADANGVADVFVRDRETGTTERVSVATDGSEPDMGAFTPAISPDGRTVAFHSFASNLVPGDTNGGFDVFLRDRVAGTTERVSVASDGTQGASSSSQQSVGAGGRWVAFSSFASNLVPGGSNGKLHIFVRDRGPEAGVGGLAASVVGDRVEVSGWATLSGAEVSAADDPAGDGQPGATEAGGDLTFAAIIYRPESADLFVRLGVAGLPGLRPPSSSVPAAAGAPGVVHGMALEVSGSRYEVRALRASATGGAAPHFALYRCDAVCVEVARLSGTYGTTGAEVTVSVPLSALGGTGGSVLGGLRAFTALGEAASGGLVALDEVALPAGILPASSAALAIAPAGTAEDEVAFDSPATLSEGTLSGSLDAAGLPPGDYDVWARVCLGERCGTASSPVRIG